LRETHSLNPFTILTIPSPIIETDHLPRAITKNLYLSQRRTGRKAPDSAAFPPFFAPLAPLRETHSLNPFTILTIPSLIIETDHLPRAITKNLYLSQRRKDRKAPDSAAFPPFFAPLAPLRETHSFNPFTILTIPSPSIETDHLPRAITKKLYLSQRRKGRKAPNSAAFPPFFAPLGPLRETHSFNPFTILTIPSLIIETDHLPRAITKKLYLSQRRKGRKAPDSAAFPPFFAPLAPLRETHSFNPFTILTIPSPSIETDHLPRAITKNFISRKGAKAAKPLIPPPSRPSLRP
jgi:hypothetical protein